MTTQQDLARQNRIMRNALLQISGNTVNGKPTVSAYTAKQALARADALPQQAPPKPEVGISFIKLP